MLGATPYDDQKLYFDASPIRHVGYARNALKVLVIWGADDGDVLPAQSEAFVRALRQARFFVRTIAVPGAGHFWFSEEPIDAPGSATGKVAPGHCRLPQAAPGVTAMIYDVAIVGCGPVGALAANLLGRPACRCWCSSRRPRPTPCPAPSISTTR
jgi:acetyl esterase/lipase